MKTTGNTILVTGANAGIGLGLAKAFLQLGNKVIIAGRRQDALDSAAAAHPGLSTLLLDQGDAGAINRAVDQLKQEHPAPNVLINNAGIQRSENLLKGDVGYAEEQITTNLLGPIRLTAELTPHLLAQPSAAIINVTSALGFMPQAMTPTYCATKAALHAYTLSLRFQLRDTPVDVLEIIPPWVQTGLQGERGHDSRAMPLDAFLAGVMDILTNHPEREEVVVDEASAFRYAERDGKFDAIFQRFNESRAAEFGNPPA